VILIERRVNVFLRALPADHFGAFARNHVDEPDGIEGVFPMNDQKRLRLVVQIKILAEQTPHRHRPGVGSRPRRVIGIVSKRLDVADDVPLRRQRAFERCPRTHSRIVIDCQHALAQIHRRPGGQS